MSANVKTDFAPEQETDTYIIVAAYNEESTIFQIINKLRSYYSNVVVVDDGSRDNTASLALKGGGTVLRHVTNRGQGAALQTGICYALEMGAVYIVTFDADGQHQVEDIESLLRPLIHDQADAVLGSRFLEPTSDVPSGRRLLLKAGILFTRLVTGIQLSDSHNGMRAFNRKAASQLNIQMDRMAHASEIVEQLHRARLRIVERPVKVVYTDYSLKKGQSSKGALIILLDLLFGKLLK